VAASPEVPAPAPDDVEVSRGIVRAGRLFALVLVVLPVWRAGFAGGLLTAALFSACGIAIWLAACSTQRLLLFGRGLQRQVRHGNHAAAWATAANQVAIAVVVSHSVYGDRLAELPPAIAFAALGLVTWAVFVALFRAVTTYPDGQEIAGENQAAALSYAGSALALAAIIGHALDGPFAGWGRSLGAYVAALVGALALYPVRQVVVGGLLLGKRPRWRGGQLDREIGQRRSTGVAALEAVAYLATALFATYVA
jgi:uncharacterized membrane protein YjfL (UPF0719 family)